VTQTSSKQKTGGTDTHLVSVIIGSASDAEVMQPCRDSLDAFGVGYEAKIFSAHRTPNELVTYVDGLAAAASRS